MEEEDSDCASDGDEPVKEAVYEMAMGPNFYSLAYFGFWLEEHEEDMSAVQDSDLVKKLIQAD